MPIRARVVDQSNRLSDRFAAMISDGIAEELRNQLPAESRGLLGADEATFAAALEALAKEGADDVLARLQAPKAAGES